MKKIKKTAKTKKNQKKNHPFTTKRRLSTWKGTQNVVDSIPDPFPTRWFVLDRRRGVEPFDHCTKGVQLQIGFIITTILQRYEQSKIYIFLFAISASTTQIHSQQHTHVGEYHTWWQWSMPYLGQYHQR